MYELHDYFRSGSAHRVRIALNLKGIAYATVPVDLNAGEQHEADFRTANPQGMVPVYADEKLILSQSMAIIEYLDERYPEPPLMPRDIVERARVRQLAQIICCDVHPLNAFRVVSFLKDAYRIDTKGRQRWFTHWLLEGLDAIELWLTARDEACRYCVGDHVTVADVCLVPQLEIARRNRVDLGEFPRLAAVETACMELDAFRRARPDGGRAGG